MDKCEMNADPDRRPEDKSTGYKVKGLCPVWDEILGGKLAKDGLHLVAETFTSRLGAKG